MPRYEVTAEIVISTKVKLIVEADSPAEAIEQAQDALPSGYGADTSEGWKATMKIKPPKGVEITSARAYRFAQTSGGEKAKRLPG